MMENQDYEAVIDNAKAPYINATLAKGGTVFARYDNIAHPSLPNYLALLGGDTYGVADDDNPPHNMRSDRNFVDLLEGGGKSWKSYMESMPSNNYAGDAAPYVVHHNPFAYFSDITTNAARTQRVVPFGQFSRDLASAASTPTFVWVTPNLCHDMHDCSVSDGDTWLSQQVPPILSSPACQQGKCLVAVVWDEDEGSGHLPALLYGSGVRAGYRSMVAYTHYALLHTIERALGLPTLTANDAGAQPMTDAFSN
jgi:acid phosphatase